MTNKTSKTKKPAKPSKAKKPSDKVVRAKPISRRKQRRRNQKELKKQEQSTLKPLSSSRRLALETLKFIGANSRLIGRMMLIYGLLYFLLARTSPEFALTEFNDFITNEEAVNSNFSRVSVLLEITLTGNNTPTISILYGLLLFVIVSLSILWTIRAIRNDQDVKARDGFYQGLTAFVPYICVGLMIALHMLPFALGAVIYSAALSSDSVVSILEEVFFIILWFILSLPTLYWLGSSIIAAVVVSIPGYYPMRALESAKQIVGTRRAMVMRRLLGGALIFGVIFIAILVLAIVVVPAIAYIIRDIMLIIAPFVANIYLYKVYEELIADE